MLKKIYCKINNSNLFDSEIVRPSIEAQKTYLESFPQAKDDYDNSFFKYKCVIFYYYSRRRCLLYNIMSAVALPFFFIHYKAVGYRLKPSEPMAKTNAIIKSSKRISFDDIIPDIISERYRNMVKINDIPYSKLHLNKNGEKIFLYALKKHPLSFYYNLILLIRLSQQCYLIDMYSPRVIFTYVCEREFCDPLLTHLSESNNVRYEAFMHGDYLYTIYKAFMHYSCYYVWDEFYKKSFEKLRCKQKMVVYTPKKFKYVIKASIKQQDYEYFATYYFSGETKNNMLGVKTVFDFLSRNGMKCKVRPHPRFSDNALINEVFSGYLIENSDEWTLERSLESTFWVIALNSTVLSQAYYTNKNIAIDDCTDRLNYKILLNSDYIMLYREHELLSNILKKLGAKRDDLVIR